MMKNRSIRTLTTLAAVAALATVVGCSKNDKDDSTAKAPAQTAPETVVSAETKTDAKLLALKFHHDD